MSSSRLRKYNSRNSFFIPESECHFFILFPSVSEPSKLSFDGVWWWIYQANKSVTQAETYLSGHFSETKVAPQEITTSSRPLLFWIVYLMTSSPVSVLPKTSWLTTMFLVGLLWSFCTGDDRPPDNCKRTMSYAPAKQKTAVKVSSCTPTRSSTNWAEFDCKSLLKNL